MSFLSRHETFSRYDSDSSLDSIEFLDENNNSVCPFNSYYDYYNRGEKQEGYKVEEEDDSEYDMYDNYLEETWGDEDSDSSEEMMDAVEVSRKDEEDIEHLLEQQKRLTVGKEYTRSTCYRCLHCMILFFRVPMPCIYLGKENGLDVFKPRRVARCGFCRGNILHLKNRKRRRSRAAYLSADCAPGAPCKWLLSGMSCRCANEARQS
ncbi:uncharacterized protein [Watersipora subatra]|uniref:uncharacterized protein n=1 Tax=Watersipora subatra TaxID=2589382 RepID=UPI00355C5947